MKQIHSTSRPSVPTFATACCLGFTVFFSSYGLYSLFKQKQALNQIQFRKEQLRKPIYKLSPEQMIIPPWNKNNLRSWEYRRVEIEGRPLHRFACLIPRKISDGPGFQYVIPLLAKENQDHTHQQGLIMSKGFIPQFFKDPGTRRRIEDTSKQTFVGFVSTLPELKNTSWLWGNATNKRRLLYTCSNMDDFVQSSGFVNTKEASVALVERLHETGKIDERSPARYEIDSNFTVPYPYAKTEAGALQLPKMPWEYQNESYYCLVASIASLIVAASIV